MIRDMRDQSTAQFKMIDVGRKRLTRRRAVACGHIMVGEKAFGLIQDKALPKGDVLALAEIAGITGAKKTSDLLPMCHPLAIDQAAVHCIPVSPDRIDVFCQVAAHAKTGVEMEAITGAQAALACIWDLVKGTEPNLTIGEVRLLLKEGGRSGLWVNPDGIPKWLEDQLPKRDSLTGRKAAILVMSDRAAEGEYEDRSGPVLKDRLESLGAEIMAYDVVRDDHEPIEQAVKLLCDKEKPDLLITSGGTGPGPRDITPDVLADICDRMLDGLGEVLRRESAAFTDTAWLSRMNAGMRGKTLIVSLPGSPKAVGECLEILEPFLGHALNMIEGQGH